MTSDSNKLLRITNSQLGAAWNNPLTRRKFLQLSGAATTSIALLPNSRLYAAEPCTSGCTAANYLTLKTIASFVWPTNILTQVETAVRAKIGAKWHREFPQATLLYQAVGPHEPALGQRSKFQTEASFHTNYIHNKLKDCFDGTAQSIVFQIEHRKCGLLYDSPKVLKNTLALSLSETGTQTIGATFSVQDMDVGVAVGVSWNFKITLDRLPVEGENAGFGGQNPPNPITKTAPCLGGAGQNVGRRWVRSIAWEATYTSISTVIILNNATTFTIGGGGIQNEYPLLISATPTQI